MTSTVDEICQQIASLKSTPAQPTVIAFANAGYATLTENWIWHMRRIGVDNVTLCALDDETLRLARTNGTPAVRVGDTARLADLWILRAQLFRALASQRIDFIHSDVDAIWLRDPRPRLLGTQAQLAFSQGTVWPNDIARAWGFVLCCGLFLARATPTVAEFFERLSQRIVDEKDDQTSLNRALRDGGATWDVAAIDAGRSEREWNSISFSIFADPLLGKAGDLSLALMPHAEFPRLPDLPGPRALVAHPIAPKDAKAKIERLAKLGLWGDLS